MPLKLTLKPGETFVVNGAVITVGDDGRSLLLRNDAVLLRQRDIMQLKDATSPARRLYLAIMLMYLEPNARDQHGDVFQRLLAERREAAVLPETQRRLDRLEHDVANGNYYRALKTCRELIQIEDELLALADARALPPSAAS